METKILTIKHELCPSCMEIHDVQLVEVETTNIFKDTEIKYQNKLYHDIKKNEKEKYS